MQADFGSIFIYWSFVLMTLVLVSIYEKESIYNSVNRVVKILVLSLPLAILAGLRNEVGTDYQSYVNIIENISSKSLKDAMVNGEVEILFSTVVWIIKKLFISNKVVFFVCELLTLVPFMIALDKLKNRLSMTFSVFLYYIVAYHMTYNIVRQEIAMSFVMLAIVYLLFQKYLSCILLCITAFLFHRSAIISLTFIFVCFLLRTSYFSNEKITSERNTILFSIGGRLTFDASYVLRRTLFYAIIVFSSLMIQVLLEISVRSNFLNHYEFYLNRYAVFNIGVVIYAIAFTLPLIIICANTIKKDYQMSVLRDIFLLYIPVTLMQNYVYWTYRLRHYPELFVVILVPMVAEKENCKPKKCILILYYILFLGYHYVSTIIIGNENETFPFRIN